MTVEVKLPNIQEQYITKDGRLTVEGAKLFLEWVKAIQDHEVRLVAGGL